MGGGHGLIHNEKVASYKLTQIGLKLLKKRLTSRSHIESDKGKIQSLIETYQRIRRNQSLGNKFRLETNLPLLINTQYGSISFVPGCGWVNASNQSHPSEKRAKRKSEKADQLAEAEKK